jgi:hypothetical protein
MYEGQKVTGALAGRLAEPMRQAEVDSQMQMLTDVIDQLQDTASRLCQRLGPVQRMGPPPSARANETVAEMSCPLAEKLRCLRERVASTDSILADNLGRLEI